MEKYATLFLAMYDGRERRLTFSNAGHLPPLVLGARGSIRRLEDGGTVVGLFDEVRYDEGSVQLRPGELFLARSEEHTSELQSHLNLVCRLLLEKKKSTTTS